MSKQIVSPLNAYLHAYNSFPEFPDNWYITENFKWREVFVNEMKSDGVPTLEVFNNAYELAKVLQQARTKIGKAFNVHCWVRQIPHNKRAGSTAERSPHINGRAIDFDVTGMTPAAVRAKLLTLNLPIRIEANTPTWIHIDVGNSYTNDYKYGIFYA